jgi:hypothetical protein
MVESADIRFGYSPENRKHIPRIVWVTPAETSEQAGIASDKM